MRRPLVRNVRTDKVCRIVLHVDHRDRFDAVVRANRIMILGVLWSAFVTCVISSLVYDVGHWLNVW